MSASRRVGRAGVVLVTDGCIALIRRVREGRTYYVVPGGGVHPGETFEEAAAREAREELGVSVTLGPLLWEETHEGFVHRYFAAASPSRDLRMSPQTDADREEWRELHGDLERGTYEPVWVPVLDVERVDVRPARVREFVKR